METAFIDSSSGVWLFGLGLSLLFGLMVGSFLNVVIHRLPIMMERRWAREAAELRGEDLPKEAPFNLMVPRSRCPGCGSLIHWFQNIPVLSYALLGGKCGTCQTKISLRYPLVELVTGGIFAWIFHQHGATAWSLSLMVLASCLIALGFIDWDTMLLPDDITLPLTWAGLIVAALGWSGISVETALWGAVAGYLSLWSIYWGFKLTTGKEGMGYGDFKLFAALGAWFGWNALIPIILLAAQGALMLAVVRLPYPKIDEKGEVGMGPMPFGPFLALGGLLTMVIGLETLLDFLPG